MWLFHYDICYVKHIDDLVWKMNNGRTDKVIAI